MIIGTVEFNHAKQSYVLCDVFNNEWAIQSFYSQLSPKDCIGAVGFAKSSWLGGGMRDVYEVEITHYDATAEDELDTVAKTIIKRINEGSPVYTY